MAKNSFAYIVKDIWPSVNCWDPNDTERMTSLDRRLFRYNLLSKGHYRLRVHWRRTLSRVVYRVMAVVVKALQLFRGFR